MSKRKPASRPGRRSSSSSSDSGGDSKGTKRESRRPTSGKGSRTPKNPFGINKGAQSQKSPGKYTDRPEKRSGHGPYNSSAVGKADRTKREGQGPYRPGSRRDEKKVDGTAGAKFPKGPKRERPYRKSGYSDKSSPEKNYRGQSPRRSTEGRFKKKYGAPSPKVQPDLSAPAQTGKIRLNKFIANSGVCSRREADELIKMGLISVNGKVITEMGYKVNPGDEVRHESKVLRAERPVYILLNKPKGFLTTTSDPQERNTVMHLLGNSVRERVYPVGRLDRNTTGLLLLTNDGDLADKLMHPSYNVKKIYKVELDRPLTKADAQQILDGVKLEEGKAMVDDIAIVSDDKRTIGIEIHIGWNRVVRRIFEALNYEVIKLDRSVYAGLDKKNLGRGEWRFLTREELVRLKHFQ
jgi:23S rRNA pseudouridine2605 synthase